MSKEEKSTVFDFEDYRDFVLSKLDEQITRGSRSRFAQSIRIHPTTLSQVLSKSRHLSYDQAFEAAQYFALSLEETEFFLLQLQFHQAATVDYKLFIKNQMQKIEKNIGQISRRVPKDTDLSNDDKMTYYSSWKYSAIRNLCSLTQISDEADIGRYLRITDLEVRQCVGFLTKIGLLKRTKTGLTPVNKHLHEDRNSTFANQHHRNWRLRLLNSIDSADTKDIIYTAPVTLSKKSAEKIREILLKQISESLRVIDQSPSEELWVLSIDWVKI